MKIQILMEIIGTIFFITIPLLCCSVERRPSYFIPKMPDTYITYLIEEIIERESKIEIRVLEK